MSLRDVGKFDVEMILKDDESAVKTGEQVIKVPKYSIYSGTQVRKFFDEESLETLSRSLEDHGQIQPIIVGELDTDGYKIQQGESRWRAAMLNKNITHLDCIIRKETDSFVQLAENLVRSNLTPFEVGEALAQIKKEHKLKNEGLAKRLSIPLANVKRFIGAAECSSKIKDAYHKGVIKDISSLNTLRKADKINPKQVSKFLEREVAAIEKDGTESTTGVIKRKDIDNLFKTLKNKPATHNDKLAAIKFPTFVVKYMEKEYYIDTKNSNEDTLLLINKEELRDSIRIESVKFLLLAKEPVL